MLPQKGTHYTSGPELSTASPGVRSSAEWGEGLQEKCPSAVSSLLSKFLLFLSSNSASKKIMWVAGVVIPFNNSSLTA